MVLDNEDALKAEDVAKILKIGRNAVYDMAKSGELRSYRIGRKLRFTYSDIQDYINNSRQGGFSPVPGPATAAKGTSAKDEASFRLYGQDPILDALTNYAGRLGANIMRVNANSYDGLYSLYKGEASAACCNLLDLETGTFNTPFVKRMLPGTNTAVIHLAKRIQGFFVAKGNPRAIVSWADLAREDIQFVNREKGSGARLLLDAKLKERGIDPTKLNGYDRTMTNESAIASLVARGIADVGIGKQITAAMTDGVDFVPLFNEQFDMVITQDALQTEEGKALIRVLTRGELKRAFSCTSGYDTSQMGKCTFVSG